MVKNEAERQAWMNHQRAMFAYQGEDVETIAGRDYSRALAKKCPKCQSIFYTYRIHVQTSQTFTVEPEPRLEQTVLFQRETCGHPECADWEHKHQVFRREQYAREHRPQTQAQTQPTALVRKQQKI